MTDLPAQPITDGGRDLADNRAGAMAGAKAAELRQAAPVRTFLARLFGVHGEERAWRIGAEGEVRVAASIKKVCRRDPRWQVLHAVPVGEKGSDIDHVIIGPGGVFTLNAKHHPDAKVWVGGNTIMVNGKRVPYVRNSRFEAARAARLLTAALGRPVAVTAVIVVVGAREVAVREAPPDVHVVTRFQLRRWLGRRPETLDSAEIEAVYAVARRASTWRRLNSPTEADEPQRT